MNTWNFSTLQLNIQPMYKERQLRYWENYFRLNLILSSHFYCRNVSHMCLAQFESLLAFERGCTIDRKESGGQIEV